MSNGPISEHSVTNSSSITNTPIPGNDVLQGRDSTIHTERYAPWKGTLQGRSRIVGNTINQGFRHILSNKWVKVLIVLTWVFNVVFPLLFASFGGNNLMQSSDDESFQDDEDAFDLIRSYDVAFPLSETIEEGERAIYDVTVMNTGEKTDIVEVNIAYVDEGWSAILVPLDDLENLSGDGEEEGDDEGKDGGAESRSEEDEGDDGEEYHNEMTFTLAADELATFGLVVMPPEGLVSGKGIVMLEAESLGAISASSGIRFEDGDWFEVISEIYAVTLVGHTEGSPYHFIMTSDFKPMTNRTVKAGEEIGFPVTITNTGSVDETFIIRVDGLQNKWKYRIEGLDELSDNIAKGEVGVYLLPGENRTFTVIYDTPKYPGSSTFIGVVAYSVNDPSLSGGVITIVDAKDIPDRDMTSQILADPDEGLFGFLFMLFALFLAAVAGSRAISEDMAQKSFTVYLSRPIKKLDYIAIKFGSVGAAMCLGTMVPILVAYAGLILFSSVGSEYIIEHLWVWGAIVLYSLLVVIVLTSLSLAFSSLTVRRFYAAFGLVVSYLISAIISSIMTEEFNEKRGSAVSIFHSIQMVGTKIFDVPDITYEYEWTYNLLALATIVVICMSVVMVKVWRTNEREW